jgi:acyl-CoA thioesterase-1
MRRLARPLVLSLLFGFAAACSIRDAACGKPVTPEKAAASEAAAAAEAELSSPAPRVIAFLGDSLTEGLGLLSLEAYPVLVGERFEADGYTNVRIFNAGISGDTTAGGLRRLDDVLTPDVKILVVALGGNDALRGLPAEQTKNNLVKIVQTAREKGVMVLLAGMEAPPNLGEDYQISFRAAFVEAARLSREIEYMPFLLDGVAGKPELNQADGIHPNKQGAALLAENMYPRLKKMIDLIGGGG